jgi:hypothetical protein
MIGALAKTLEQGLAISDSHFLDASGTTWPATDLISHARQVAALLRE